MFTKKILVSALIAAGTLGAVTAPLPGVAASNVEIYVNTAPPPPRYTWGAFAKYAAQVSSASEGAVTKP